MYFFAAAVHTGNWKFKFHVVVVWTGGDSASFERLESRNRYYNCSIPLMAWGYLGGMNQCPMLLEGLWGLELHQTTVIQPTTSYYKLHLHPL